MERAQNSTTAENVIPEITAADVLKEGYLYKQSRFLKEWRKYEFICVN